MYWANKMVILISKMYDLSSSNVWKVLLICHVVFCCPWTLPMHTDDICSFYITVWGQFSVFYRNTQGNILHFNNSIFHVYSHSVELKLSDILLTEAHTLEALYWEFYNGGPLKIKRNISIYFIDGIIVFSFFHRLNWLFNLFGCDLYVGGGRVREIDISLNIFLYRCMFTAPNVK